MVFYAHCELFWYLIDNSAYKHTMNVFDSQGNSRKGSSIQQGHLQKFVHLLLPQGQQIHSGSYPKNGGTRRKSKTLHLYRHYFLQVLLINYVHRPDDVFFPMYFVILFSFFFFSFFVWLIRLGCILCVIFLPQSRSLFLVSKAVLSQPFP